MDTDALMGVYQKFTRGLTTDEGIPVARTCIDYGSFTGGLDERDAMSWDGFPAVLSRYQTAFSDFGVHVEYREVVSQTNPDGSADLVVRYSMTVTHDGGYISPVDYKTLLRPNVRAPRKISVRGIDFVHFNPQGLITSVRIYINQMAIVQQLD
jgi:hypothetical protein